MSNVYFIGDTHFGHKNILKYRPEFSSIEEHDETITENILSVGGKRNTLYLLGDIIFSKEHIERILLISSHFEYTHWVLGNHDTDNTERQEIFRELVTDNIVDKVYALAKKHSFWLSHAPVHPDELRGCRNIHGHVHNNTLPDKRYFNASCENIGYKPIDLNHIKAILDD